MAELTNPVEVGKLGAVFGVKGWLKLHSFTETAESIFEYGPWFIKKGTGEWQELLIKEWKPHTGTFICRLEGIDQREDALLLTGYSVYVDESSLPELADGDVYIHDLVGMQVVNLDGYDLGTVTGFMETGANYVLNVKATDNDAYDKKERLLPLVFESTVKNVDFESNVISVDWDPDF